MLGWWLGKAREEGRVQDGNEEREPPETPAPVFAARALKSALFGTPARPDDETLYEIEKDEEDEDEPSVFLKAVTRNMSPTKPSGILLTPGTGPTRRKTVTFGNEVVDKTEENKANGKATSKSGIPDDCPGKFPSPWTAKSESKNRTKRKTSLTKAFEKAKEGETTTVEMESMTTASDSQPLPDAKTESRSKSSKSHLRSSSELQRNKLSRSDFKDAGESQQRKSSKSEPKSAIESQPGNLEPSNEQLLQQLVVHDGIDNDITVDLNEPRSQSGKFWKENFEQYHEDAKAEMAKLLKYKQLAKSYAKLKDVQSINLEEKLKEEQRKVACMEDKISRLSAQIAAVGLEGNEDESPELVKELGRQTALAVQYKNQVEEFRLALNGSKGRPSGPDSNNGKRPTSPQTDQTLRETHRELKKARDQIKETVALREEMSKLRQTLSTTEKTVTKLHEENTKLTQELLHADLRLETHLEKCEKKGASFEERRQKRDEEFQQLQKDYNTLKENAKKQRRDAEQLLKGRHDQVVKLRNEIKSMRGAETTVQELQRALQMKTEAHNEVVTSLQKQIEALRESQYQANDEKGAKKTKDQRNSPPSDLSSKPLPPVEPQTRESQIPLLSPKLARPSKALASSKQPQTETPRGLLKPRSSHSALSEIVNRASADSVPPTRYGPVQHTPLPSQVTPLTSRFSNMSLESPAPEMQLPSPEPSLSELPSRAIHDRNCRPSPRPSMFNIASSPPKAALVRSQTTGELSKQRSSNDLAARRLANVSSSRLSSLENSKDRVALPPERAAAARARLEQKNAQKKRLQGILNASEKENVRMGK